VNSGPQDLAKGKNEHFRVLGIEPPTAKGKGKTGSKKITATKISEISRSSLFTVTEKDAYQRVTRLSRSYPNQSQLGAAATGLAQQSEIVLFEISNTGARSTKGTIKTGKEAVDMDFIQTGKDEYIFAYCDEHDIYTKKISSTTDNEEPECIYVTPMSRTSEKPTIPKFRALRWLTKDFIIMLTNIHSNGGVVAQIFRLPPSGKGQCRLAQSHRLPSSITKATGLAVSNLTPPESPSAPQEYTQFVIAVAGHNISISLFKVDLQHEGNVYMVTPINPFRTFKNVHPLQITSLSFSNFTPPSAPVTTGTPPQYLKLASTGIINTVIVHTLPLFPVPLSVKRGQSRTPRYVVALPSTAVVQGFSFLLAALAALFTALLVQSVLEIRGNVRPYLGARDRIPVVWQEALGKPYVFPDGYEPVKSRHQSQPLKPVDHSDSSSDTEGGSALRLPEFFADIREKAGDGVVFISETLESHETNPELKSISGVNAQLHDGEKEGKKWDELDEKQRELWKRRLSDAGHWAEGLPETLFKGMLFGELAGAVGGAVAGAI